MMSEASALSLELAGLLLCYGLLDWALRREGLSALEGKWLLGLPFFLLGTTIVWTWPKILDISMGMPVEDPGVFSGRFVQIFLHQDLGTYLRKNRST